MLHDDIAALRQERIQSGKPTVPDSFQGVSKARVKQVLDRLALGDKPDLVDAVFALLDNGCHVGVLQRGRSKLDREGRDYWIKPMQELGGVEAVTLIGKCASPSLVTASITHSRSVCLFQSSTSGLASASALAVLGLENRAELCIQAICRVARFSTWMPRDKDCTSLSHSIFACPSPKRLFPVIPASASFFLYTVLSPSSM